MLMPLHIGDIAAARTSRVIFYHPAVVGGRISGSGLRPKMMLQALKDRGHEVFEISGNLETRRKQVAELKKLVRSGERFEYLYFENLSSPLTMRVVTLPWLKLPLPLFNAFDLRFILFCRRHAIKVAYFYRDIHWRFPDAYGGAIGPRRILAIRFFGLIELMFLRLFVKNVFVPTDEFGSLIRESYGLNPRPLQPGCILSRSLREFDPAAKKLRLFYVGGCGPIYDPTVFFDGVGRSAADLDFVYCTRPQEWSIYGKRYKKPDTVSVVHLSGENLNTAYESADVCIYPLPPVGYGVLAHSFKVSEYVGQGKPIIAFAGTAVAGFIERHDIGWVVPYEASAVAALLDRLSQTRDEIAKKTANARALARESTWEKIVQKMEQNLI
jgi:hypothetical protein